MDIKARRSGGSAQPPPGLTKWTLRFVAKFATTEARGHMVELDEQTRIVETACQQKLTELSALKKSLLDARLRGELWK